jgi:hypothetical protein
VCVTKPAQTRGRARVCGAVAVDSQSGPVSTATPHPPRSVTAPPPPQSVSTLQPLGASAAADAAEPEVRTRHPRRHSSAAASPPSDLSASCVCVCVCVVCVCVCVCARVFVCVCGKKHKTYSIADLADLPADLEGRLVERVRGLTPPLTALILHNLALSLQLLTLPQQRRGLELTCSIFPLPLPRTRTPPHSSPSLHRVAPPPQRLPLIRAYLPHTLVA